MASTRQGGLGIGLPPGYDFPLASSDTSYARAGAGPLALAAGETFVLPAGQYMVRPGPLTMIQVLDPVSGRWAGLGQGSEMSYVSSDGANVRLANLTGCAIGAFITNVGSGYTSAPTVTPSAGGSQYRAIVGGAVNGTVTITSGGVGYSSAPMLVVSPPPAGGVQATAVAGVSGGVINSVTVIDQGAGYTTPPTITVVPDARDTVTTPAVLTPTLTGAGTITAIICTNQGTPVTSVPTLTIAGGGGASGAATAVMCFTATGITVDAGGVAYGNAQPFGVLTVGGVVPGAAGAVVNPALDRGLMTPRQASISGTSTAGGAITATGAVITDSGLFQAVPRGLVIAGGSALATTVGQVTIGVGGASDTSLIYPF